MTRLHPEDVTTDHAHDELTDSTSMRTYTPAQQRVATVLGLGRRTNEREWRAVVELAGMTECHVCDSRGQDAARSDEQDRSVYEVAPTAQGDSAGSLSVGSVNRECA